MTLAIYGHYSCGVYLASAEEVREVVSLSRDWEGQSQTYLAKPKIHNITKISTSIDFNDVCKHIIYKQLVNDNKKEEKLRANPFPIFKDE